MGWRVRPALFLWLVTASGACAAMAADSKPQHTIVTFGTSLTARGGWQAPLKDKLSACLHGPVSVRTVAQSGATSDWGSNHVAEVVRLQPDIVVIEFYANDASLHRFISVRHSRETIAAILTRLRAELPQARLIVQVMNPFSGMRGMIRPFLESYIHAHLEEAEAHGAEIADHRPAWAALPAAVLASSIPDGAHPLLKAASGVIVPTLARLIGGPGC